MELFLCDSQEQLARCVLEALQDMGTIKGGLWLSHNHSYIPQVHTPILMMVI